MQAVPIHGAYTTGTSWTPERSYCVAVQDNSRRETSGDYLLYGGASFSHEEATEIAEEWNKDHTPSPPDYFAWDP